MGYKGENISENGVDFYLYMDLSRIINEKWGSEEWGTQYVYGKAIRGWTTGSYQCVEEYRKWIWNAYTGTVWAMVNQLSLKNNFMAVTIMGFDPYLMCGLTNSRVELINCINPMEFDVSKEYDGRIRVNFDSSEFNPYEEICSTVKQNKTLQPKRKAVGIVIVQSHRALYQFSSYKEKIKKSVRDCEAEGVEIITIGVRNDDANYEDLINTDEVKALSTNQQDSSVYDYETMLKRLGEIVKKRGGAIDYWWEATHTLARDWAECLGLLNDGSKEKDARCANEYGKRIYYDIYAYEVRGRKFLVRSENAKYWQEAKEYFEIAAQKGITEAKLFLEKEGIPEDYACEFMGKQIDEIEILKKEPDEALKENNIQEEESKGLSIASLVIGILSMFCFNSGILPIVGIILGMKGRNRGGKGMATAGIVLNILAIVIFVIMICVSL